MALSNISVRKDEEVTNMDSYVSGETDDFDPYQEEEGKIGRAHV